MNESFFKSTYLFLVCLCECLPYCKVFNVNLEVIPKLVLLWTASTVHDPQIKI